jgi:hypothetical protein
MSTAIIARQFKVNNDIIRQTIFRCVLTHSIVFCHHEASELERQNFAAPARKGEGTYEICWLLLPDMQIQE